MNYDQQNNIHNLHKKPSLVLPILLLAVITGAVVFAIWVLAGGDPGRFAIGSGGEDAIPYIVIVWVGAAGILMILFWIGDIIRKRREWKRAQAGFQNGGYDGAPYCRQPFGTGTGSGTGGSYGQNAAPQSGYRYAGNYDPSGSLSADRTLLSRDFLLGAMQKRIKVLKTVIGIAAAVLALPLLSKVLFDHTIAVLPFACIVAIGVCVMRIKTAKEDLAQIAEGRFKVVEDIITEKREEETTDSDGDTRTNLYVHGDLTGDHEFQYAVYNKCQAGQKLYIVRKTNSAPVGGPEQDLAGRVGERFGKEAGIKSGLILDWLAGRKVVLGHYPEACYELSPDLEPYMDRPLAGMKVVYQFNAFGEPVCAQVLGPDEDPNFRAPAGTYVNGVPVSGQGSFPGTGFGSTQFGGTDTKKSDGGKVALILWLVFSAALIVVGIIFELKAREILPGSGNPTYHDGAVSFLVWGCIQLGVCLVVLLIAAIQNAWKKRRK